MVPTCFPDGASGKEYTCLGREDPLEKGNSNPLQYSCLENPMDRGAWWATVHGVAKSQTRLNRLSMCTCTHMISTLPLSDSSFPYPED